ncbi:MAG: hypothetical protein WBJ10_09680, partial [Daejeonella sp.]|uniref:hypothetical protein n=1 Tax=Daejeonella sp. TaxID=2805397 RepID=UPI003C728BFF
MLPEMIRNNNSPGLNKKVFMESLMLRRPKIRKKKRWMKHRMNQEPNWRKFWLMIIRESTKTPSDSTVEF